ncbi:MAG: hypothetical protein JSS29_08345 [Proteobacteria bacterium]|nr:hypothetical protein [Pseudomonadota bacterium]
MRIHYLLLAALAVAGLAVADPQASSRAEQASSRNEARERPARGAPEAPDTDDVAQKAGAADVAAGADDDDKDAGRKSAKDREGDKDKDDEGEAAAPLSLTDTQQEAVGIRIDAPQPLAVAPVIEGYGTVLDPVLLLTDLGRLDSARAAASAASADAARQEGLYHGGVQASLKTLQLAQAQSVEAGAAARAAQAAFRAQWGPLASLGEAQRHALLAGLDRGERLLVRADVPGRHFGGELARDALLEVDGTHVTARVLGVLPRADAQSQSAGWLLEVLRAPVGLGPGAHTAVQLRAVSSRGLAVPATALVFEQGGAYVYRRTPGDKPNTYAYRAVAVRPRTRVGDAWLVEGLGANDQIVVQGAGVLWSLQGISGFSAAEEDHD